MIQDNIMHYYILPKYRFGHYYVALIISRNQLGVKYNHYPSSRMDYSATLKLSNGSDLGRKSIERKM